MDDRQRPILNLSGRKQKPAEVPDSSPRQRPMLNLGNTPPSASGAAMGKAMADMITSVTYARHSSGIQATPPRGTGDPVVVDTPNSSPQPRYAQSSQFDRVRPIIQLKRPE